VNEENRNHLLRSCAVTALPNELSLKSRRSSNFAANDAVIAGIQVGGDYRRPGGVGYPEVPRTPPPIGDALLGRE
jgi:hypothetical protein